MRDTCSMAGRFLRAWPNLMNPSSSRFPQLMKFNKKFYWRIIYSLTLKNRYLRETAFCKASLKPNKSLVVKFSQLKRWRLRNCNEVSRVNAWFQVERSTFWIMRQFWTLKLRYSKESSPCKVLPKFENVSFVKARQLCEVNLKRDEKITCRNQR